MISGDTAILIPQFPARAGGGGGTGGTGGNSIVVSSETRLSWHTCCCQTNFCQLANGMLIVGKPVAGCCQVLTNLLAVDFGAPKRFGAMTIDGKDECVGGIRFFDWLARIYNKVLHFCMRRVWATLEGAFALLAASLLLFTRLGAEFIPTLDEGDFAMQKTLPAGSSLTRSIEISLEAEKVLKEQFPEVKHVVAKIGTAEVPTDPMSVEDADVMIVMKPFHSSLRCGGA